MPRLFVAIRPPELIRNVLVDAMDEGPGLAWVADDNIHLTLRFIGEVERPLAEDIARALAALRVEPFTLQIHGIGKFERRQGGALWAGVTPRAEVAALAAKVERACVTAGLAPEHRAFHPHITLARWKRGDAAAVDALVRRNANLASDPWRVERITLYRSHLSRHGAHYEPVAEFGRGPSSI